VFGFFQRESIHGLTVKEKMDIILAGDWT